MNNEPTNSSYTNAQQPVPTPGSTPGVGSLLDGLDVPKRIGTARPPKGPGLIARRITKAKAAWQARIDDPTRRKPTIFAARGVAAALLVAAGVGLYFALRPVPQPDDFSDPLNDVFNYTLLTDEFNKLPVEKRLELIAALVKRMQSMNKGDSMLLAAFGAGIAGQAREQIKENASQLAVDMWDKYAKDYRNVPEQDRSAYLDKTFVDFMKNMEALGGNPRDISDQDRLAEVKKQAQRDRQAMREPGRGPDGEALGSVYNFMNNDVGSRANPQQRVRGQQLLRDMGRHFRGQDPETGKPATQTAPAPAPAQEVPQDNGPA